MEEKSILKIYNGVIINQLFQIDISRYHPKHEPPGYKKITNTVVVKSGSSRLHIAIPKNKEVSKINFHASVWKLLDFLTIKFTEKNSHRCLKEKLKTKIEVPISEYIALRTEGEISDPARKKLVREIKEDLFLLSCMSIEGEEMRNENKETLPKTPICTEATSKNGIITFVFSEALAFYLVRAFPASYPVSLMKLDAHNSNLYPVGRKLAIYHSIRNNKNKGTNKKIRVDSVLPCCPSLPLHPKVDETVHESVRETILKGDRHWSRRIYEPFEKTLKELNFDCVLKDAGGKVIDRNAMKTMKFTEFQELFIHFSIPSEGD